MRHPDLFDHARLAKDIPQTPRPEDVRSRLEAVLEELRSAESIPWTQPKLASWKIVFPNMSKWLPPDDREILIAEFERQLSRLGAAE